jgi:hypothetical protein
MNSKTIYILKISSKELIREQVEDLLTPSRRNHSISQPLPRLEPTARGTSPSQNSVDTTTGETSP